MPVNPKSLTNLVTVHLESGVTSEVYRVRARVEVQAWFKAMTAEERGAVLARSMIWEDRRVPAVIATYTGAVIERPAAAPAGSQEAESAETGAAAPSRSFGEAAPADTLSLHGLSSLRVVSSTIPSPLRNDLRWPPLRYQELETTLSREAVLKLETIRGKTAWRTSTGESIRKDTVSRLLQAGLLQPA